MPGRENNPAASWPMNDHRAIYRAQRQSSVIAVTNFVFNATWQKLRLSAGPPWTARAIGLVSERAPARKAYLQVGRTGRGRTDEMKVSYPGGIGLNGRTDTHPI